MHTNVPVIRELLVRRFGLEAEVHFRIHPHQGKGKLPSNPLSRPDPKHRQLLHQLPAKLLGYARSRLQDSVVLVVLDSDETPGEKLLAELSVMMKKLPVRPDRVLFKLAIEETESWFIADTAAVLRAFPKAKIANLKKIPPGAVVGAWEQLAQAIGSAGSSGTDHRNWAEKIAPHLDLYTPRSPSLQLLIDGISQELKIRAV
jgi:hypothetical protein